MTHSFPNRRSSDLAVLECRIGVGGQDLGPFITVVPSPVATGEQVRKIVREAMPGWWKKYRHFFAQFVQRIQHRLDGQALRLVVYRHVEQGKLNLPQHLHAAWDVADRKRGRKGQR